jgi:hypothetical protein
MLPTGGTVVVLRCDFTILPLERQRRDHIDVARDTVGYVNADAAVSCQFVSLMAR